ncbi:hypothetical protein AUEXF2481DRAFT_36385 [Aureobasidium subglaciale EXF-2481]|uniref:Uncharacterized protein n=1 Tax=Aureobasidium subglaciale (strain EXF-2481) TaxID=1043005 RepID=A0A074YY36_AURSE|nr:uncharacterized protein AUEXF2481DRAFT_36385 [Aureobasidium subglaciale EXF-2481]KAI5205538.1 hypothetical protein E4T38_04285 [Aureobasidium subglaciale]KAI5224513.1 hypothetical protein E4T40_03903 [Aureobasidium subglaciale]KAI5227729.1 hypothetical protein E4T41_04123 [Aureobasidium subglaciale]KAI5263296.1 hypothetical protein E4T46_03744 [Aureobasidium subglaciale]KEQ99087.1 hypothetical protein AUEXF2481DRAFT_36385 [Aureobasidium subglaciale EXF-2481]
MKKSFAARRVPRKIGHDDADAPSDTSSNNDSTASSTVKRPSAKHRKSSSLRPSFADDDNTDSTVVTPKRTNLSRLAIQRNAEKRSDVAFRPALDAVLDRPTYNRDHLDELKQSTPATPKDVASASTTDNEDTASLSNIAVDVKSKFGSDLSRYQPPTAIPTAAEIQEKKARRARLAKENDFISLEDHGDNGEDDDDAVTRDDQGRLILKPKEKYPETRLVHDDEDMLEGFDDFTTDGNITFGRKAQKEEDQKRRAEMASMIANVEGQGTDDDEDDDESEAERNAAFEVAQTRHGTYAAREQEAESTRPQTPPKVVPLPTMDSVVERLRKRLEEMESVRANKANEMQSLVQEKTMIGEEEVRVQAALKETGEKYQKLREDMGLETQPDDKQIVEANGVHQIPRINRAEDSDSDDEEGAERPGLGTSGLGSGMRRDMSDWGM